MRISGAAVLFALAFALGMAADGAVAATAYVSTRDNAYSPSSLTVNLGDTVQWCNDGDNDHSVVADDGLFGSGTLHAEDGDCYSYKTTTLGTFRYDCNLENMSGTITVRQPPPSSTAPVTAPAPTSAPATSRPREGTVPREEPASDSPGRGSGAGAATVTSRGGAADVTIAGIVGIVVPDLPEIAPLPTDVASPSTAGQFAINEVGSERDRGQLFAVFASAGVVALGAGYLLYHLRFGRRG